LLEPVGDLLRGLFHSKRIQDAGLQRAQALDLSIGAENYARIRMEE